MLKPELASYDCFCLSFSHASISAHSCDGTCFHVLTFFLLLVPVAPLDFISQLESHSSAIAAPAPDCALASLGSWTPGSWPWYHHLSSVWLAARPSPLSYHRVTPEAAGDSQAAHIPLISLSWNFWDFPPHWLCSSSSRLFLLFHCAEPRHRARIPIPHLPSVAFHTSSVHIPLPGPHLPDTWGVHCRASAASERLAFLPSILNSSTRVPCFLSTSFLIVSMVMSSENSSPWWALLLGRLCQSASPCPLWSLLPPHPIPGWPTLS